MSEQDVNSAGAGEPDEAASARTSRPRPTPTGRARRASAAAVQTSTEVRRPSPRPGGSTAPAELSESVKAGRSEAAGESRARPATGRRGRRQRAVISTPVHQRSGARAPLWLAIGVGALAVLGLVAVLLVAVLVKPESGSRSERDQALSAAKAEVPVLLSYDYRTFDAGLAKAKALLTGRMVDDYTKAMTTSIKPNAVKLKAVVQATTDGGGVESVSPDGKQVVVLIFGEQKVTESSLSAPRTDLVRVRATLDLVKGQWLVSNYAPL